MCKVFFGLRRVSRTRGPELMAARRPSKILISLATQGGCDEALHRCGRTTDQPAEGAPVVEQRSACRLKINALHQICELSIECDVRDISSRIMRSLEDTSPIARIPIDGGSCRKRWFAAVRERRRAMRSKTDKSFLGCHCDVDHETCKKYQFLQAS